jgi:hypothetical protein
MGFTIPVLPRKSSAPTAPVKFLSFRLLDTRSAISESARQPHGFDHPTRLINLPSILIMTTEQVRDYLEKRLFLENTVVRGLESP